jgi:hypothetical protein
MAARASCTAMNSDTPITRRQLIGSAGAVSVLGTLPLRAAINGAPASDAVQAEFAYEARIRLDLAHAVKGPDSGRVSILGGHVTGPAMCGTVTGGDLAWTRVREQGFTRVEAHYTVRLDNGSFVHVVDQGVLAGDRSPVHAGRMNTTPAVDAMNVLLVGVLDTSDYQAGEVGLRAYKVV